MLPRAGGDAGVDNQPSRSPRMSRRAVLFWFFPAVT